MRFAKWLIEVLVIISAIHILSLIIEREFNINIPAAIIAVIVTIVAEVFGVNDI